MSSKTSKASVLHPEPHKRTQALNDQIASFGFNRDRQAFAEKETQTPIKDLITGVKDGVLNILRGTGKLATDLVTSPIATVANAGRWAWDVVTKPISRIVIATSDTVGEKTFGKVSGLMRSIKEKVHNLLTPSGRGHNEHGHEGVKSDHGAHGNGHGHGNGHKPPHH
jgi:hypothetical protein